MTPSQHRFQWFLLYIIFLCICNTYSFRGRLFWPNNVKFSNTNVGTSRRPFLLSSILSTNIPEPPVIRYLEKELQLSNDVLKKIILRFPWILYLQVTTNLQPTIEVFHAFGFKIGEIRNVVSHAPSVLAINYQWTLPEKLISIQKMFFLSQEDLIRVVVSQPYLITSSIDRNYRTASFLTNVVQFTESEVQCLITAEPRIAMSSVGVLQRCWSVLTKLYGIPAPEARALILRYPPLLSSKLMKNIKERLILFSSELNAESFPSPFVQALAHRFPPILYIDTAVFMKPNLDLLKELLSTKFAGADSVGSVKYKRIYELLQPVRLEDQRIASRFNRTELVEAARNLLEDSVHHNIVQLVKTFPQLLAYNPVKLRLMCINALYFLTGERQLDFATSAGQQLGLVQPSVANGDFYFPESGDCMNEDCVFDDIGGEFKSDGASTTRRVCSTGGGDGGGSAVEGCAEVVLAAKDLEEDVVEKWFHSSALDPQWLCSLDRISDIVSSSSPPPDIEPSTTSSSTCSSRQQSLSDGSVAWRTDDEALKVYARQGASLSMDMTRAVHILRTAPWIVSYRIVRSQGVLAALAVTLGMTNAELSKCVQTYPRLLSLSIDGKLSSILRTLALFAADFLSQYRVPTQLGVQPQRASQGAASHKYSSPRQMGDDTCSPQELLRRARYECTDNATSVITRVVDQDLIQAVAERRADPVRTLVRELIMRYPLILGTSLTRVQERFASAAAAHLSWSDYLKILRWSDERHDIYKRTISRTLSTSFNSSTVVEEAQRRVESAAAAADNAGLAQQSGTTKHGDSVNLVLLCDTAGHDADHTVVEEESSVDPSSRAPVVRKATFAPVRTERQPNKRRKTSKIATTSRITYAMRKRTCGGDNKDDTVRSSSGGGSKVTPTHIVSAKEARIFEPYPDALKLQSMFANQRRSVQKNAFKLLNDMLPF